MQWERRCRQARRLAAILSGVVLLQAGGCVIDDALMTQLANLVLQLFLTAL